MDLRETNKKGEGRDSLAEFLSRKKRVENTRQARKIASI